MLHCYVMRLFLFSCSTCNNLIGGLDWIWTHAWIFFLRQWDTGERDHVLLSLHPHVASAWLCIWLLPKSRNAFGMRYQMKSLTLVMLMRYLSLFVHFFIGSVVPYCPFFGLFFPLWKNSEVEWRQDDRDSSGVAVKTCPLTSKFLCEMRGVCVCVCAHEILFFITILKPTLLGIHCELGTFHSSSHLISPITF